MIQSATENKYCFNMQVSAQTMAWLKVNRLSPSKLIRLDEF